MNANVFPAVSEEKQQPEIHLSSTVSLSDRNLIQLYIFFFFQQGEVLDNLAYLMPGLG